MRKSTCAFLLSQYKKIIATVYFLLCTGLFDLHAQNAIVSSGNDATGTGGNVSLTIGQIVYSTISGTNGSIIQGVQQPFEISEVTGIEEANGISLEFTVYPNPVTTDIMLRIEDYDVENLRYQLYDINGKALEDEKIYSNLTTIKMQEYLPGIYFLKVSETDQFGPQQTIKTFKIVKN